MVAHSENPNPFTTAKELGILLNNHGYETRFAGGCVRDMLMGRVPKDYDLATTATPEEVTKLLESRGVKVIPTGISHGTVTAVKNSIPFEITTLRTDVKCDGRRAEVVFSTSFEEDAVRRDFTINALFQDMQGRIYDYVNGQKDLKEEKLLFVGDPEKRIQEDALRILRYFRFLGRFNWSFNPQYSGILVSQAPSLSILSRERIKAEFDLILVDAPDDILPIMYRLGLFPFLFEGMPLNNEDAKPFPTRLFGLFPGELTHSGFRWFTLFNYLYSETQDLKTMARTARLTKKERFLMDHLQKIITEIPGKSGVQPCLKLLRTHWITGKEVLIFLKWFESSFFFHLPEITEKVLESFDTVKVPSISKFIKTVDPPEKRKQFSFLFRVSCYLKRYNQGEDIDFNLLERELKEQGFDSQREFNGIT